jgi:hypothetical protein
MLPEVGGEEEEAEQFPHLPPHVMVMGGGH